MTYHVKIFSGKSLNPITRKTPTVCRDVNPARCNYVIVTRGDGETLEQTRERLTTLDPSGELCESCAAGLEIR